MDELDSLVIGKTLEGGWVIQEPRHVQRDSPSACRAYVARNAKGANAFVKVLDPRANGSLQDAQNNISQFIYERAIVDVCTERKMHRRRPRNRGQDGRKRFPASRLGSRQVEAERRD